MPIPESPNGDQQTVESAAPGANTPASPTGAQSDSPSPSATPDAKPSGAESSPAATTGETKPETVYDAVNAALEKQRAPAQQAATGGESPTPAVGEQESQSTGEANGDARQVATTEPKASERLARLLEERKTYLPKAQTLDQLSGWMRNEGLTQNDFTRALNTEVLCKTDPARALSVLEARANELRELIGINTLPADLQTRLDQGYLDEQAAQELALARNGQVIRDQRAIERAEAQRQETFVASVQRSARAIGEAVTAAEIALRKQDPDYPLIQEFVAARVAQLLNESTPETPEGAVEQYRRAVREVKASAMRLNPAKPQILPREPGLSGGSTLPPPKTALEAAKRAVAATQG